MSETTAAPVSDPLTTRILVDSEIAWARKQGSVDGMHDSGGNNGGNGDGGGVGFGSGGVSGAGVVANEKMVSEYKRLVLQEVKREEVLP
jgi:hypothetical protein